MSILRPLVLIFLFSSPIIAQNSDVRFSENATIRVYGDSFTNNAGEWHDHVNLSGVFGDVTSVSSGGRNLAEIENALADDYTAGVHDAIVVAGGVNDIADNFRFGTRDLAAMQISVQEIIDRVEAGGNEHIILATVAPFAEVQNRTGGSTSFFDQTRQDLADDFDAWINTLAQNNENISVFDLRGVLDADRDGFVDDPSWRRGGNDLLHPTNCEFGETCGSSILADAFVSQFGGGEPSTVLPPTSITSAVVSDGANLTTLDSASEDPAYPSGASAILQSINVGGFDYSIVAGSDSYVGDVEGVVFPVGGSSPGESVALGDLDLSTGTLDPLGDGGPTGEEYHNFASQNITEDTVFFLFNNGTPSGTIVLVDGTGAAITAELSTPAELELNDFSFDRTNGGPLNNRDVSGIIFSASAFTFTGGNTVADVAGFRGSGSAFDAHDTGIAMLTEAVLGDFDSDGDVDSDDVDFYIGNLGQVATGDLVQLDMNGDGFITLDDHNQHVTTLVTTSNGVTGALLGDVNLDGIVDVLSDAFALVGSLGQSVASRDQGDINADGVVDVLNDAFILVGQLGQSNGS